MSLWWGQGWYKSGRWGEGWMLGAAEPARVGPRASHHRELLGQGQKPSPFTLSHTTLGWQSLLRIPYNQTLETSPPPALCQSKHPVLLHHCFPQQNHTRRQMSPIQICSPVSVVPLNFICSTLPTRCKSSSATSSRRSPPASQAPASPHTESHHGAGKRDFTYPE